MTTRNASQPRTGTARTILDRLGSVARRRHLPRLADAHPESTGAPRHWRGIGAIPVAAIDGTDAMAAGTRGSDFLPIRGRAPAGWQLRWERLNEAARDQVALPPIVVVSAADGYWVVDGHNRVALAKSIGQEWIDAEVTELSLPSAHAPTPYHSPALAAA